MKQRLLTFAKKIKARGKKLPKTVIPIVGLAAILICIGLYLVLSDKTGKESAKVDCRAVTQNSEALIKQKKYTESYDQLKSVQATCAQLSLSNESDIKDPAKFESYAELFVYKAGLARTAYVAGDKEQATIYADEALKINKLIPDEQRSKLPDLLNVFYDMSDIKDGVYPNRKTIMVCRYDKNT